MVSHDLRTILGGIALGAARLVRNAPDDSAGLKTLQVAQSIQRHSARMNRLIGDLIDVTSIEAGRLAVNPDRQNAAPVAREAAEAFQPLAAAKEVSLELEITQDALPANFDHDRILQVLGNLLSNAIKFTPPQGHIR
ncbi:MAG TPA: histidine kinase dimerization/phospho-acceptor domain-containing protein, partial [Myxococcaceae bacterium]|nr:histidine kinase dimerization/phospho-acceptor domain-containing protein [Myxococcaceae bacterium]